ncbi:MAG: LysR family transcriptional regulator, partial [Zoogloea sp.]|nr:LysR family transcriptional regulator [Zoogloea sp.]
MKLAGRATLKQLRALKAVSDTASFTLAARLLNLTQPAISMQIRELEELVGEVLVDGRREVRLTAAGEILVRHVRTAINALDQAEVELKARRGVVAGTLEVAAITTSEYFVPQLLAAFGREYPDIGFRLSVHNRAGMLGLIRDRRVDLAIMGEPPGGLPLNHFPFAPHHLSFVAAPDHPLAGRKRIPPSALEGERLLLREQGSGTRVTLERFLASHDVKVMRADEMGSNETLKQAAMAGMGIAFLSHHTFAMELQSGRLVRLDVKGTPVEREWNVLVRADRAMTPAQQALLGFLQEKGAEFGATTGRRRRCGWLDAVLLRDSVRLNGVTGLAITKLDVLDGLESLRICTHYERRGRRLDVVPATAGALEECRPVYETLPGWAETTSGVKRFARLPQNVKAYLRRIEELTGVPIDIVSTGPDRDQTIVLRNPY